MKSTKLTAGIYGIQDIANFMFPVYVHDHSFVLFSKGKIINYLQLERFTKIKYDNTLYSVIDPLLKSIGLTDADSADVIFTDNEIGRAFISKSGKIRFEAPLLPVLAAGMEKGNSFWFGQRKDAYVLNHELSHIYSCIPFYGTFKENSLLVHSDGGASKSNFSAWHFVNGKLQLLEYHYDLKYLSNIFNANALVFSIIGASRKNQNSLPGKFMGFAAYGSYREELEDWLVTNNYFADIWSKKSVFFRKIKIDWGVELKSFDQKNPFIQDVAATLHYIFEREMLKKFTSLQQATGARFLYYTGGSALNIKLNAKLVNSGLFEDIFIPPCTGDCGLSIGAASYMEIWKGNVIKIHSPYLNNFGIENCQVNYNSVDIEETATLLMENNVIGICNGYGEAGPRALGNRSIISLADSKKLAKKVNEFHKGREWYRPLAPVMLEKNVKYFTGLKEIHPLSRFMLIEFRIQNDRIPELAGAVHIDKTARIQTLFRKTDNPFLYDLLMLLDKKYNVKALINTSFNNNGFPMVHTENDAMKTAGSMKLNAVVINGKLNRLC